MKGTRNVPLTHKLGQPLRNSCYRTLQDHLSLETKKKRGEYMPGTGTSSICWGRGERGPPPQARSENADTGVGAVRTGLGQNGVFLSETRLQPEDLGESHLSGFH